MINRLRFRPVAFSFLSALLLWGAYPGGGEIWPLLMVARLKEAQARLGLAPPVRLGLFSVSLGFVVAFLTR